MSVATYLPSYKIPENVPVINTEDKGKTFRGIFDSYNDSELHHFLSFGDSHREQHAIINYRTYGRKCYAKSVKFAEEPTIKQLIAQQELLHRNLDWVYNCCLYI